MCAHFAAVDRWLATTKAASRAKHAMDVGCGCGVIGAMLLKHGGAIDDDGADASSKPEPAGINVTSVDINPAAVGTVRVAPSLRLRHSLVISIALCCRCPLVVSRLLQTVQDFVL